MRDGVRVGGVREVELIERWRAVEFRQQFAADCGTLAKGVGFLDQAALPIEPFLLQEDVNVVPGDLPVIAAGGESGKGLRPRGQDEAGGEVERVAALEAVGERLGEMILGGAAHSAKITTNL